MVNIKSVWRVCLTLRSDSAQDWSHMLPSSYIFRDSFMPISSTNSYHCTPFPPKKVKLTSLNGLYFLLLIVFCTLYAPHPFRVPSSLLWDLVIFLNPTEAIQQFHFPLLDCQLLGVKINVEFICFPRHLAHGMILFHLLKSNTITHPLAKMADDNWGETQPRTPERGKSFTDMRILQWPLERPAWEEAGLP